MVQVRVTEGILEGEVVEDDFGGTYCSFKGIPYAAPPVGDLRFKAPQAPKHWDGVRDAKEHGSTCIQFDMFTKSVGGTEDCLYLNVYTPSLKPNAPLPVMVWIHGGAFMSGSGNDDFYGPEFLIRHGVIVVTINYRLEALGFLCLDTEDIPGNAGMKDQVAALRWVQKNIKNFGGDPKNVTIFGESAGGASVGFHLISPMSKGLFKRAIPQSGSPTCFWAQAFEPRERALLLAKQLGCYSEDDRDLYEFFKTVQVDQLIGLKLPVMKDQKLYELSFGIASEQKFGDNERFFYSDVIDALNNSIHEGVEVMTGYTKDEGLMALAMDPNLEILMPDANAFKEFYVPKPIKLECSSKIKMEVARKMKEYYMGKNIVTPEKFDDFLRFLNMDFFVYAIIVFAKFCTLKNKTYLYKFNCNTERNVIGHMFGLSTFVKDKTVCHADDIMYLFPIKFANLKLEKDSETAKIIEKVTTLWTNFAKYGDPTPDSSLGVKWSPLTLDKQSYLNIGNELIPATYPEREDLKFWEDIFKQYLPRWTVAK